MKKYKINLGGAIYSTVPSKQEAIKHIDDILNTIHSSLNMKVLSIDEVKEADETESNAEIPVYDSVPEATDLIDDVYKVVRDNVLGKIARKIEQNQDNNGDQYSHLLHQVYSAVHSEICAVLNLILAIDNAVEKSYEKERQDDMLTASFDEPPF